MRSKEIAQEGRVNGVHSSVNFIKKDISKRSIDAKCQIRRKMGISLSDS